MKICALLAALLFTSAGAAPYAIHDDFGGVEFSVPSGWVKIQQNGKLAVAANEASSDLTVVLVVSPAKRLQGQSFRAWFDSEMAANLGARAKVIVAGQVTSQEIGALKHLTTARAVQDSNGATRIQMFHAISSGDSAAVVMGVAASQKALDKYSLAIRGFFESLNLLGAKTGSATTGSAKTGSAKTGSVKSGPGTTGSAKTSPTTGAVTGNTAIATVPPGKGEPVPKAGLVNGKPQGLFIGVSVLSGNPVFLLFLDNGRVFSQLPPGGLNKVDWDFLVKTYPNSTGTWSIANGRMALRWRGGGVWQDAIVPTARGMKFNGKSYSAAAYVNLAQMSGRFEGAVSTAWLNAGGAGPSMTRATTIVLDGKGGFSYDSAVGGDVGNAVAYSAKSSSGIVAVEGYDAVFRHKDGHSERMSMVRFPDDDSFILNGTYYIKKK